MAAIAQQTYPHSILSRGVAGTRRNSIIVNFPGSPKACKECFAIIESKLPHIIDLLRNNLAAVLVAHHENPPVLTVGGNGDNAMIPGKSNSHLSSPLLTSRFNLERTTIL